MGLGIFVRSIWSIFISIMLLCGWFRFIHDFFDRDRFSRFFYRCDFFLYSEVSMSHARLTFRCPLLYRWYHLLQLVVQTILRPRFRLCSILFYARVQAMLLCLCRSPSSLQLSLRFVAPHHQLRSLVKYQDMMARKWEVAPSVSSRYRRCGLSMMI